MSSSHLVDLIETTFLIGVEFILVAFFLIIFAGVVYGCIMNVKFCYDKIKKVVKKESKNHDNKDDSN